MQSISASSARSIGDAIDRNAGFRAVHAWPMLFLENPDVRQYLPGGSDSVSDRWGVRKPVKYLTLYPPNEGISRLPPGNFVVILQKLHSKSR
jgi:hypothetical protein